MASNNLTCVGKHEVFFQPLNLKEIAHSINPAVQF